jgi:hypothetical protein
MSKISTIELKGSSGKKYTFDVYSYSSEFEKFSCVYCISKRELNKDNKFVHNICYICKTEDISSILTKHPQEECFVKNNANCISIYKLESEQEMAEVEEDLKNYYKPVCNNQSN